MFFSFYARWSVGFMTHSLKVCQHIDVLGPISVLFFRHDKCIVDRVSIPKETRRGQGWQMR